MPIGITKEQIDALVAQLKAGKISADDFGNALFAAASKGADAAKGAAKHVKDIQAALKGASDEVSSFFDNFKNFGLKAGSAAADFVSHFEQMGPLADSLADTIGNIDLGPLTYAVDAVGSKINSLGDSVTSSGAKAALAAGGFIILTEALSNFGTDLSKINEGVQGMTLETSKFIQQIEKITPQPLKGLVSQMAKFGAMSDEAKKLENALLMTSSAAGDLSTYLEGAGDRLERLDDRSKQFSDLISEAGTATGLTSDIVGNYAKSLMQIPGALRQNVELNERTGESMSMLKTAILAARGSGQDFASVMDNLNFVYKQFGTTGDDAIKMFTRMHMVQNDLKIPMDIMRTGVQDISRNFKFFGDNTQGAITVLSRFGRALEGEIGPQALQELTSGFMQSISKMDIAQKAFLAGRTGGAQGLRGAFQIDLELEEGNLEKVTGRVESAMKQMFGGRIVTLQEAATDARAAAQMAKQIQFMTQGPFGALVNSAQEAYKAFKVMSDESAGPEAKKEIAESFQKVMGRGDSIRDRQTNALLSIRNDMANLVTQGKVAAYQFERIAVGTQGIFENVISDRIKQARGPAAGKRLTSHGGFAMPDDIAARYTDMIDEMGMLALQQDRAEGRTGGREEAAREMALSGPAGTMTVTPGLARTLGMPEEYAPGRQAQDAERMMAAIPLGPPPAMGARGLPQVVMARAESHEQPAAAPGTVTVRHPAEGVAATLDLNVHMCPQCTQRMNEQTVKILKDGTIEYIGEHESHRMSGLGR